MRCSLIAIPKQLQHKGENVNDVSVDLQSASDVVLRADGVLPVPQDQLRVISQEQCEADGPQSGIDHVEPVNLGRGSRDGVRDLSQAQAQAVPQNRLLPNP